MSFKKIGARFQVSNVCIFKICHGEIHRARSEALSDGLYRPWQSLEDQRSDP